MKRLNLVVAILVIAGLAAFAYEHSKTRHLQLSLDGVVRERDAMSLRLKDLERHINSEKARAEVPKPMPAAISEIPAHSMANALIRDDAVGTPAVSTIAPNGWGKNGSNTGDYIVGVDSLH